MAIDMPFPARFRASSFGLETNTQTFTSPFNKETQRYLLGGARWKASFTLPRMDRDQQAAWRSFFDRLEGSYGTFNAYDPDYYGKPRGNPSGTPLVNGASQTGSSLITDGWTASTTILKIGDYFTVNGELKRVTADATSDGSGNATLSFKPALRNSPGDNAALTVRTATCLMVLADDMQAMWDTDERGISAEKVFSAIEVFS